MSDAHLLQQFAIRRTHADELIDLRHRVLRAGLPREMAIFTGDELQTSHHFGAFNGSQIVCCATFHFEPWENAPAFRLRGMATEDSFRSRGIGKALLKFAEDELCRASPIRQLWANARTPAIRFYQSLSWTIISDIFDIPTAGPHYRIIKTLR